MKFKTQLLMVSAVALALAACSPQQHYGDRVCSDTMGRRVDQSMCSQPRMGGGTNPYMWYYLGSLNGANRSYTPAPVGSVLTGGSFRAAPGVSYGSPGFAASSVARGGFGAIGAGSAGS